LPFCFEVKEDLSHYFGERYQEILNLKRKRGLELLKKVKQEIEKHTIEKPE
jgi:hypothetical protein